MNINALALLTILSVFFFLPKINNVVQANCKQSQINRLGQKGQRIKCCY